MKICKDGHDEIIYDSLDCPLCEVLEFLKNSQDDVEKHLDAIEDLQSEIEDLKNEITDLKTV